MRLWTAVAVAATCLAAPAVATAAQISAGPSPVTYSNPNIEIAPGESVTFLNFDLSGAPHDVTSIDVGPGAENLFRSDTVGFGVEVPVVGAEKLKPGSYKYLCSVHTFMEGQITVSGGAGGGGATQLVLTVGARDQELERVEESGRIRLRATLNEAATVVVKVKKAKGGPTLASGRATLDSGSSSFKAKLTDKGEDVVAKGKRLELEVEARAATAAGNPDIDYAKLTLR